MVDSIKITKKHLRYFIIFATLIILASLGFVLATTAVVRNGNTSTTIITLDDNNTNTINISINITGPSTNFGEIYNITAVLINISVSGKQLNFTDGTENHSALLRSAALSHANISVAATNWSINWTNTTGLLNATGGQEIKYFWFGVTPNGPVPVKGGNISVQLFRTNTSAANVTNGTMLYNITLNINDTIAINYVGRSNVSGVNLSQNYIPVELNITNNQTGVNLTVTLWNSTNQIAKNITFAHANTTNSSSVKFNFSNLTDGTDLPDGVYKVEVLVTNNFDDMNYTGNRTYRLDKTVPTVTLSKSAGSTTKTKIVVDVTVSDAGSGATELCEIDNTEATMTGNGTTAQTLTHDNLNCETTKTYIVTCQDQAGNRGSSSQLTVATNDCDAGGGSGGGVGSGTGQTWTQTFVAPDEEFRSSSGYKASLSSNERVRVKVGSTTHHVGVQSIIGNSIKIVVSSDPQEATLSVGDIRKFDVNDDSFYDVSVTLNSVVGGKADITLLSISEEVTEESEAAQQEAEEGAQEELNGEVPATKESRNLLWLWILIAVIIIVIVIVLIANKKKK